jgi:hypothetical protein
MRKVLAVTLFISSQILSVQAQIGPRQTSPINDEAQRRIEQRAFEEWATQPEARRQAAARRQTEEKLREFYAKAQRFVSLWKKLTEGMSDEKTFNVKLAREVSKAFHDLEKSDGWPAGRSK